jgi:hypothetical protein
MWISVLARSLVPKADSLTTRQRPISGCDDVGEVRPYLAVDGWGGNYSPSLVVMPDHDGAINGATLSQFHAAQNARTALELPATQPVQIAKARDRQLCAVKAKPDLDRASQFALQCFDERSAFRDEPAPLAFFDNVVIVVRWPRHRFPPALPATQPILKRL